MTDALIQAEGGAPPCMVEFTRLREEFEKKGIAAKAASQRHASHHEMCKLITSYAATEARWIDVVEASVQICGIPVRILNQLQEVHANNERARVKSCTASVAPDGLPPLRMHMDDFLGDNRSKWRLLPSYQ
jgi:hypothetical protein